MITGLCLIVAAFAYPTLPEQILIQWSEGYVTSSVAKEFIAPYPLACILIRFLLTPFIWRWLQINMFYGESITNYIRFREAPCELEVRALIPGFSFGFLYINITFG